MWISGKLAGFVLVRELESSTNDQSLHSIAEFFILRKYRRCGLGQTVANHIFNLFPGRWQVRQEANNLPAQAFWRKVIASYTGGDFAEVRLPGWAGPAQEFSVR